MVKFVNFSRLLEDMSFVVNFSGFAINNGSRPNVGADKTNINKVLQNDGTLVETTTDGAATNENLIKWLDL